MRDRLTSSRIAAGAAVAIGSTVLFADGASAATFTVTNNADAGAGSLRDAIDQANASPGVDDIITFDSTVTGTITLTTGQLEVTDGGGLEIRGPGADQLEISGNNASRVFYVYSTPSNVPLLISGLTITEGAAPTGAGLINFDQAVTIRDSVVMGNAATDDGGGLFSDGFTGSFTLENTEVSGNTAGADGGGIYVEDTGPAGVQISDSQITDNTASDDGAGAYFYDPDSAVLFSSTTISGNTADGDGGGIHVYDTDGGPFRIEDSAITGNSASEGGAAFFYEPDDAVQIVNTTIAENQTTGTTGGLFAAESEYLTVDATTIAGNQGIGFNAGNETPTLTSSIVADNGPVDVAGDFNTDFDLIENPGTAVINETTAGSNKLNVDPQLGALADNGGPTETLLPGSSSPALEAANTGLTEDQRGLTRPVDLTEVAAGIGNQSDMGAVELQAIVATAPPTVSGQPAVGQTLSATTGTFSGNPTSFSYQWLRCDAGGGACQPIAGATQATYTVTAADVGNTLRVEVTPENAVTAGSPARSAPTGVVPSGPVVPDTAVKDPFLELANPQVQKGRKIKLEVVAGAGESVRFRAGGKIFINNGNAVKMEAEVLTTGQRVTVVITPKTKAGSRRIRKALKKDRKVVAKINASLTDDAGNVYSEQLTARLKR